jgi:uncharacterized protein YrrD
MDLGEPSSYLTLDEGTPVYSSDGVEVGTVAHVLADPDEDIFDGIVIKARRRGPRYRFADAPQIDSLHERGVVLTVDATGVESLPEPSESPPIVEVGPDDVVARDLGDKLRRAWLRISGKL